MIPRYSVTMKFTLWAALAVLATSPALAFPAKVSTTLTSTSAPEKDANGSPLGACEGCFNTGNDGMSISSTDTGPKVHLKQGTYVGRRQGPIDARDTLSGIGTSHAQDHFLGIRYALPPTGDRRYRRAERINTTNEEVQSAKQYGYQCVGVGQDDTYNPPHVTYALGEDCLSVNVLRPSSIETDAKLPVWVFIHGGGFYQGGTADRRYNGSWIVDRSIEMDQPIIFVSLQYRVDALGFPVGKDAEEEGLLNLGLYDQQLALEWIQDNINAFGGDRSKVTIMGESAGGASVFVHYTSRRGQEEAKPLFRSGIAHSGYFAVQSNTFEDRQNVMQDLQRRLGCDGGATAKDRIACLRNADLATYVAAEREIYSGVPTSTTFTWSPQVDGEIIPRDIQLSFADGKFARRPFLVMANTDEGTSFGDDTTNSTRQLFEGLDKSGYMSVVNGTSDKQREQIAKVYPDDEDRYCPYSAGDGLLPEGTGKMARRSRGLIGDTFMVGPRRRVTEAVAKETSVFAARFDQVPYKGLLTSGVAHFVDMATAFRNPLDTQNALGPKPRALHLAKEMTTYWISFVTSGSPNTHKLPSSPHWPKYSSEEPKDLVLTNQAHGVKTYVEDDTWRREGIDVLMDLRESKGRKERA